MPAFLQLRSVPTRMIAWALCQSLLMVCCLRGAAYDDQGPDDAAPVAIGTERLKTLVQDLADQTFAVREAATEELATRCDEKSLVALEEMSRESSDFETKLRIRGIIAKIKAERLQTQVASFMRSKDPEKTFGFDGWKTFSRYSGQTRGAKKLFLTLLELHPRLVEQQLESKDEAIAYAKQIAARVGDKKSRLMYAEPGDGLALLYALNASEELQDQALEGISIRTFRLAPFSPLLNEPQYRKSLERMLTVWSSRVKLERITCLLWFIEKELPVCRSLALDLLSSEEIKVDPDGFALSMQALFRFGEKGDLPKVETWLQDKTVCFVSERLALPSPDKLDANGQLPPGLAVERFTVEYRDIALLVSLRIRGDDPQPYFPYLRLHALRGFFPETIALPEGLDKPREERIQAWQNQKPKSK